jgi:hypothetical protein
LITIIIITATTATTATFAFTFTFAFSACTLATLAAEGPDNYHGYGIALQ